MLEEVGVDHGRFSFCNFVERGEEGNQVQEEEGKKDLGGRGVVDTWDVEDQEDRVVDNHEEEEGSLVFF